MTTPPAPGLDCLTGLHLIVEAHDPTCTVVGSWCLWCGTGVYDGERVDDDGLANFTPHYRLCMPPGWRR